MPGLVPGIQQRQRPPGMRDRPFIAVYIMASRRNGTLYVESTSNLYRRAWEHREGELDGFTKRYSCKLLVWYEPLERVDAAIRRERTIKGYSRKWKLNLIEGLNPDWRDLYDHLPR